VTAPILGAESGEPVDGAAVHYYELHEGDNEVYSDVLLEHDEEYEPEEFFELVQAARRRVLTGFEEDTLVEAIAADLERTHGFTAITDERLTAAVNVSRDEDENYLAEIGNDTLIEQDDDVRTVYAEFDPANGDGPLH